MNLVKILDSKLRLIEEELEKSMPIGLHPRELYDAARHLINAGGKKFRPVLTLLSCEAVGGNFRDALPTAASIELLHTASLIHDDILDGDALRRGVRTVHSIWGEEVAITAGDLLIGKAVEIMALATPPRVVNLIARACVKMCEGEILDVRFRENLEKVTEAQYLQMIKKKSASLVRAATKSGAIIGGGSKEAVTALSNFGELIGMAFQLRDDVLNITSTETRLRKPVRTDMLAKRPNLTMIHALKSYSGNPPIDHFLKIGNPGIKNFIRILNDIGAIEHVQKLSEKFSENAKREVSKVGLEHGVEVILKQAADFASQRVF